jgi:AcrR family transcriptional regulator
VREVTLAAVTARVGLHPTAVRRYFESREELLLELAEQGWAEWRDRLMSGLGDARGLAAHEVADLVSGSLEQLPLFCEQLTALLTTVALGARLRATSLDSL